MVEHYLPAEEQGAEKNLLFLTKNALSNHRVVFDAARLKGKFTFSKAERLTNIAVIDNIFSKGKTVNFGGFALLYLEHPSPTIYPVQVTFAVPKRNFRHAHERNRVKRLLRECWRQAKQPLYETLQQNQKQYAVCVMYRGKQLPDLTTVSHAMQKVVAYLSK